MPKITVYLDDQLYARLVTHARGYESISKVIQSSLKQTLPQLPKCPTCGQERHP